MKMKKSLVRTAAAAICAALFLMPARAEQVPSISARSAIVYDCTGQSVLYERAADTRSLIASTTKIMTALVVAEHCDLSETVQIPTEAVGVEGSSLYLKAGEVLTVQELLYGLMLQSGNDAAVALAIHCSQSVEGFAARMNEKARELKLTGTHFDNPNGLDDENNYSTARDLALLTFHALENPIFSEVVCTKTVTISGGRQLTNHNKLLWRYDGCIGVKTGYTMAAGRILVSAAERGGRRLIVVTIGAPDDWNDHAKLLDYGFSITTNGEE